MTTSAAKVAGFVLRAIFTRPEHGGVIDNYRAKGAHFVHEDDGEACIDLPGPAAGAPAETVDQAARRLAARGIAAWRVPAAANGDPFAMTPVESSNIVAVGYRPADRTLRVRFHHGGATYDYAAVPAGVYRDLLLAPSQGRYLAAEIKPRYNYRKVQEGSDGKPQ